MQKVYVLINDAGEFLCKRHSGKHFASRTELVHALTYQHKKALESLTQDRYYWEHRGIDIKSFHIALYTLSLVP